MGAASLILPILLPLLIVPLVLFSASRAMGLRLAPWAPLPGLILALTAPADSHLDLPGVLLGTSLGLDATGRLFLLFTALVWLLAGGFAHGWLRDDAGKHRFWAFFLAAQAGNIGVCLAMDAASFYLLFALMSFAAYGLVVHSGTVEALRAGRVYLTMAVLGEALLVAGMLLAVGAADTHRLVDLAAAPLAGPAAILLIAGFGIKVGVPLLHMWLPLAHPVAPVPASAVLSGVMLKAGLLGWLRFLPLGTHALPEAGAVLMVAGLAAMFLGVGAGLAQRNPKVLLAYSSVSQMGFMTLGVGAGLTAPALWPLLLPAVGLYALHHALAKSALFLGVGLIRVRGAHLTYLAALALPALALAGAPLSSGMLAKIQLKIALAKLAAPWPDLLAGLLPLAALGTALLMARLLWLIRDQYATVEPPAGSAHIASRLDIPWLLLVLASVGLVWAMPPHPLLPQALSPGTVLDAAWPPLVATALGFAALRLRWRAPMLPPGDVLVPLLRGLADLRRHATGALPKWRIALPVGSRTAARSPQLEARLRAWGTAGALWLALLAAVIALLAGAG
ncbi:MAG: complex I subunit 5 family protein [Thiobacillus sp.]|nr:complex I subunit 5 family protein [Thiobacillus sp.]MDP2979780.1 complex I subunit 5 family protein [Thiobacillus sp.]